MKLITVTCKRDSIPFLLQAESISKFVAPCEHLVIIEDDDFDKNYWLTLLQPYYTKHKLTLKSYNHYNIKNTGWERQQCYKLLAAFDCNEQYLVLDSKDFFVRPCSIDNWKNNKGSNSIIQLSFDKKIFPNVFISELYANYFNKDILFECFATRTPYVIDTRYLNKADLLKHVEWFSKAQYKCEFLFYNYMAYELIWSFKKTDVQALKLWNCNDIKNMSYDNNCMVLGFHRFLNNCNETDKQQIFNLVKNIGLDNSVW